MKIITYILANSEDVEAMTCDEYDAKGLPEDWDEYVWQDQPDKETAIARHYVAHELWWEDTQHGAVARDVY